MANGFLERLVQGPVLCDGAMGTLLYARGGVPFERSFDELNLSRPDLVRGIHLDYIHAGAEVIETNTFGANRVRLAAHGLAERVAEINAAGVSLAREARRLTGQMVWVAGSVGPLGRPVTPLVPSYLAEARDAFREQIAALVEAGVDLLVMETFSDLQEAREAVLAAQEVDGGVPLLVQMTFTEEGRTPKGETPEEVVAALEELRVEVVGANCGVGPEPILQVMERMVRVSHTPLAAQPNAGFPAYMEGRLVYISSPEYMAGQARRMVEAGVSLVGGCCGTTPEHMAAVRDAIRGLTPSRAHRRAPVVAVPREPAPAPATPVSEPTGLARKLQSGGLAVTVEVDPPKGFDVTSALQGLRQLAGVVDAVNVADSPRAQGRMSALAMCSLIQSRLGLETVLHLAIRHRNLVALHSELLGAHALGVRNVLVVMGDVPQTGDYPSATVVSDITTSGLVRLINSFNRGVDLSDRAMEQATSFFVGCALNLAAPDMDQELRVLERKLKAGANFLLTQPVYSPEAVERVWQRLGGFPLPVVLGVLPLRNLRHAEYLHHEVPGMYIPEEVRERVRQAGPRAPEVGVQICQELLKAVRDKVAGAYFMVPFGHYEVVTEVLAGLGLTGRSR
ncbi:MAG: bifunctional homocysteine S-methyltransferase/methylenetetrahydrofolate reductase [Chloroflexi bacterium]|nr:bifunctional homocysteine S-methyltransferase/methylenetetrahydrofolate reductase [Chloroflexota bacterium]